MLASKLRNFIIGASLLLTQNQCLSDQQDYPFVQVISYNANNPIQDRYCYTRLKNLNAYTASVFDGHGGDLTADYASKNLNRCIDQRVKKNKLLDIPINQIIQKSLTQAYDDVQQGFLAIFKQNLTSKAYQRVGSCALTAVILKNSLHIANAGDCQGILLSQDEAQMTNLRLNAGQKFQQKRLIQKFPDQKDIYMCRSACYVKGRLQPTRSLGDFYLKFKQYNFTKLAVFTGPYIQAQPLVTHFPLKDKHTNLILATDGLWDQMDMHQIHKIYKQNKPQLGKQLFDHAIDVILKRQNLQSIHQLNQIPYRRDIHDDITLLNIKIKQVRDLL